MTPTTWAGSFEAASISAARIYDDVLVPRLFTPCARLLLHRLDLQPGEAVIDVACGPGSVTQLAATAVGRDGRVIGVDLSPAMLAIARTKPALREAASIQYSLAAADHLPVADAEFDVAVCHHGLQFFSDRIAALSEARRSLRAGGRLGIGVWAGIEHSPAFACLEHVVRQVAGDEIADRYRGGPWSMPDARRLRELLEESGFTDVRMKQAVLPLRFECAAQLRSTLAVSGIASEVEALSVDRRKQLARALERHLARCGALDADALAHLAVARR